MPPLAVYPNQQAGYGDITSYGYGGGMGPSSYGYGSGGSSDYVTPQQWDQYIQTIKEAYQASSGFEREKLRRQYEDAEKGRENALKIAQLQADNSRYGVDQQRLTAIEQLKQNDRQFAQKHALDVRNADISEAQLISSQRSEPSRLFQTMDLEQALGTIRTGGRARTMQMDTGVAALNGLSTDYTGNRYLANSGGGGSSGAGDAQAATNGAGGTDPRIKAARAVVDALPPSATEGLDPTGVAALNAVYSLYRAPLRPGTLESLSPTQRATLQSGSQRIQKYTGKSYDDLMADYRKSLPGQQSVRNAA